MSKKGPILSLIGGIFFVVYFLLVELPYISRGVYTDDIRILYPILFLILIVLTLIGTNLGLKGKKSGGIFCIIAGIIGIAVTSFMLTILTSLLLERPQSEFLVIVIIIAILIYLIPSLLVLIGGIVVIKENK